MASANWAAISPQEMASAWAMALPGVRRPRADPLRQLWPGCGRLPPGPYPPVPHGRPELRDRLGARQKAVRGARRAGRRYPLRADAAGMALCRHDRGGDDDGPADRADRADRPQPLPPADVR